MESQNENREAFERFRAVCLREAGVTYSAGAVIPLLISVLVGMIVGAAGQSGSDLALYLAYLSSQIGFLIAAVIYFVRSKEPVRAVITGCKWYYFPIAILLEFGLLFSLNGLNTYFISLLELFGYHSDPSFIPNVSGWNLLPAILVIALLPAVFEELLFRGILSRNLHAGGWGLAPSVLISGALFALYHGRPEQTIYQFLCGACYALVAIRSGSILPTVTAHFLNNTLILTLCAFGVEDFSALSCYPVLLVLSALCLAGTLAFLLFVDKRGNGKGKVGGAFFLMASVGIAVCGVQWLYALIGGFLS